MLSCFRGQSRLALELASLERTEGDGGNGITPSNEVTETTAENTPLLRYSVLKPLPPASPLTRVFFITLLESVPSPQSPVTITLCASPSSPPCSPSSSRQRQSPDTRPSRRH